MGSFCSEISFDDNVLTSDIPKDIFIAKYDNEGSEPNWLYWNGPDGLYSMGGFTKTDTMIYDKKTNSTDKSECPEIHQKIIDALPLRPVVQAESR